MILTRQLLRAKSTASTALHGLSHGIGAKARGIGFISFLFLLGMGSIPVVAQFSGPPGHFPTASAFMTVGGENSQFPFFADNSLGFDAGVSIQPRALVGAEFRIGAYPYSATYVQIPITAGYRVGVNSIRGYPYAPFAYIGGGVSRSQPEATGPEHTSPIWRLCWQADIGLDRNFHSISWRMAQASWRETYGSEQTLRSIGLSTGIVYHFQR
jgi:hypothetical protein